MGRVATQADLAAVPDLRPFEVPVLAVPFTAVNKLVAMHGLASRNDGDGLRARARDLYDLACIANSSRHADGVRRRVEEITALTERGGILRRGHAPRPQAGFGASPAFQFDGSALCRALAAGYNETMQMVWGDFKPTFGDALKLAASLDP